MRGLEAVMHSAFAVPVGTRPPEWVGVCYACGSESRRFYGRTHAQALNGLCRHLRDDHPGPWSPRRLAGKVGSWFT